ncbi:hypothetical protein V8E36_001295 [Tilletia maclaganii]
MLTRSRFQRVAGMYEMCEHESHSHPSTARQMAAAAPFEPRSLLAEQIYAGRAQEAAAAAARMSAAGAVPSTAPSAFPQPMAKNVSNNASFRREAKITINEPVNSMSLSAANRDVVLGARKGLFVVDLDNLWQPPRFLAHLTTFQVADIQFNPHPAQSHWVASTSNQKLLVWNLDRPDNPAPKETNRTIYSVTPASRSLRPGTLMSSYTAASGSSSLHDLISPSSPSIARGSAVEHILHAHTRAITDINWHSMFPTVLASCGIDSWTWVWDLRTPPTKPVQGYSAWNSPCTQIKWNRATPYRLATACDNKVLIWDERKGALPLCTIEAHESRIYGIDWSRHEVLGHDRMLTCSLDRTVKFWNLALPEAQKAIAERELVTEPESVIETGAPVWRARHLPFGQGVMTLPQRASNTLSMWAKDKPEAPVSQFEGHTDVVKEYLIRTHGGQNKASDDRTFQLITWSKDQTLRLWPITDKETEAVGHRPGAPIQVLHTRINAVNKSYRDEPVAIEPDLRTLRSGPTSTNTPTAVSASGIAAPALPRSLRSGESGASPYGSTSAHARSPTQQQKLYMAGTSPRQASYAAMRAHAQGIAAGAAAGQGVSYDGRTLPRPALGQAHASRHHTARTNDHTAVGTPVSITAGGGVGYFDQAMGSVGAGGGGTGYRLAAHVRGSTMSGPRDPRNSNRASTPVSGGGHVSAMEKPTDRRKRDRERERERGKERERRSARGHGSASGTATITASTGAKQPKTTGFMTLGGAGQGYGARSAIRPFGADRAGGQQSNAAWLTQVDMTVGATGRRLSHEEGVTGDMVAEGAGPKGEAGTMQGGRIGAEGIGPKEGGAAGQEDGMTQLHQEVDVEAAEEEKRADFLRQEIAFLPQKLPRVAQIEKIDLANRSCTICLYGPWAHRRTPVYMRIHFSFPSHYPLEPIDFDLERNLSIIPKWRAKLKAHITRIANRYAEHRRGCLLPVVWFLVGQVPGLEVVEPQDSEEEEVDRIARSVPHPGFPQMEQRDETQEDKGAGEDGDEAGSREGGEDGEVGMAVEGGKEAKPAPTEEEKEMLLTRKAMIIMPPARCGANFGPNGELVIFAPATGRVGRNYNMTGYPSYSRASSRSRSQHPFDRYRDRDRERDRERNSIGGNSAHDSGLTAAGGGGRIGAGIGGGGRFLHSYNVLSAAMSSLAQRAREFGGEDDGEQDSDLLQLMTTDFVQRRIQSERYEATATTSARAGSGGGPTGAGAGVGLSRDSSLRRVQQPPSRTGSIAAAVGRPGVGAAAGRFTLNRSSVRIFDVSAFVLSEEERAVRLQQRQQRQQRSEQQSRPPLGSRRRSSSMPSSPKPGKRNPVAPSGGVTTAKQSFGTAMQAGGSSSGRRLPVDAEGTAAEVDDEAAPGAEAGVTTTTEEGDDGTDTEESYRLHASDGEGLARERRRLAGFRNVHR